MFTANPKGFSMTFPNGKTISVQYGKGNYCDNRFIENNHHYNECVNAEVMAFDENDNTILEPQGYLSSMEVVELINKISKL